MNDRQNSNAQAIDDIWHEDVLAYEVGVAIAAALKLKLEGGFIDTDSGLKSHAGLARVVLETLGLDLEN